MSHYIYILIINDRKTTLNDLFFSFENKRKMAAIVDDETQSIVVGTGNDRVAINLKQGPAVSGLTYI